MASSSATRCWRCSIRSMLARVIHTGRFGADERQHQPRILRGRRIERIGTVRVEVTRPFLEAAVLAMTAGQVLADVFRPDEARLRKTQRREQSFLRETLERHSGNRLHGALQKQDSLAGIGVLGARGKQQRQGTAHFGVAHAPVGQPGAVTQRHACRDAPVPGLVGKVVVSEVVCERRVEVEPAFLNQSQGAQRHDGLGHRAGLENRLDRNGLPIVDVTHAETLRPVDPARGE